MVVADSSKFGVTTLSTVASVEAVDTIVTDSEAPQDVIEALRNRGVEVIVADRKTD